MLTTMPLTKDIIDTIEAVVVSNDPSRPDLQLYFNNIDNYDINRRRINPMHRAHQCFVQARMAICQSMRNINIHRSIRIAFLLECLLIFLMLTVLPAAANPASKVSVALLPIILSGATAIAAEVAMQTPSEYPATTSTVDVTTGQFVPHDLVPDFIYLLDGFMHPAQDVSHTSEQVNLGIYYSPAAAVLQGARLAIDNPTPYGWGRTSESLSISQGVSTQDGCDLGGAWNGAGIGATATSAGLSGLNSYPSIDSTALCVINHGSPALMTPPSTYDDTHFYPVTPLTPAQVARLRKFMFVLVGGVGGYESLITSWSSDGKTVTVMPWWRNGDGKLATPTGMQAVAINPATKVFAANIVANLDTESLANDAVGGEVDIENYKSGSHMGGWDIVQLGTAGADFGTRVRGFITDAYVANAGIEAGFLYDSTTNGIPCSTVGAFAARMSGQGTAFAVQEVSDPKNPKITFSVDYAGTVRAATAILSDHVQLLAGAGKPAYLDFNFSGDAGSYGFDTRIINPAPGALQIWGRRASDRANLPMVTFSGGEANSLDVLGAPTGAAVALSCQGDANCEVQVVGKGQGGVYTGLVRQSRDPLPSDVPVGTCVDWDNTVTGASKRYCNRGDAALHAISYN